jgi:hypothetical protein
MNWNGSGGSGHGVIKVLPLHFPGCTEENHEESQAGSLLPRPGQAYSTILHRPAQCYANY